MDEVCNVHQAFIRACVAERLNGTQAMAAIFLLCRDMVQDGICSANDIVEGVRIAATDGEKSKA